MFEGKYFSEFYLFYSCFWLKLCENHNIHIKEEEKNEYYTEMASFFEQAHNLKHFRWYSPIYFQVTQYNCIGTLYSNILFHCFNVVVSSVSRHSNYSLLLLSHECFLLFLGRVIVNIFLWIQHLHKHNSNKNFQLIKFFRKFHWLEHRSFCFLVITNQFCIAKWIQTSVFIYQLRFLRSHHRLNRNSHKICILLQLIVLQVKVYLEEEHH